MTDPFATSYRMQKLRLIYSGQFVSEGSTWYWHRGRLHAWVSRPLLVNPPARRV